MSMLRQRLRYRFDESFSRGPIALVAYLGVVTLAVICGFALVILVAGLGGGRSVIGQLYDSTLHVVDTGDLENDTGRWYFITMQLALSVGGIVLLSAFIGIVTTSIESRLQALRKGRSVVVERGHTLVLGWSPAV